MSGSSSRSRGSVAGIVTALGLLGFLALGVGGGEAQPAKGNANVTITMLASMTASPAYDLLISNFERAYPNLTVDATYAPTVATLAQLTTTELAAGNAPDAFVTWPGCGTTISVCKLAKAGDLAPLVRKRWTRRSLPEVISASKYGPGLYTASPTVTFGGLWTNDTMFNELGLKVPQTFPQLLDTCRKAKAAGKIPLLLPASGSLVVQMLAGGIALTTVYAKETHWLKKLKAKKVTFAGTSGWRAALQEFVDMKAAGCFGPGPAGLTTSSANVQFAQGRALMYVNITSHKGSIDDAKPQIAYSQHPFPATSKAGQEVVLLNFSLGLSVNAHASAQHQAAAQTFVDFLARPKQADLYARIIGGLTQYQFLRGEIPAYLSSFKPFLKRHQYGVNPVQMWWNADVGVALTTYGTGLITGQTSVDDVLKAMDAGWKRGPA